MSSIYLETTAEGDSIGDSIGAGSFMNLPDSWMGTMDGTPMPFPGLDASPYDASSVSDQLLKHQKMKNTADRATSTDVPTLTRDTRSRPLHLPISHD